MISAFTNIFKIPELRQRVLFTLAMIVIIRAGSAITSPGVNAEILRVWFQNVADAQSHGGVAALFNLFSGGALAHCAIFSLGVMPYISASIMMQLLTAVVPQLGKLSREDGGRRKIMQYTRYATIALCIFQGYLLAKSFESPQANPFLPGIMDTINKLGMDLVPNPGLGFQLMTIATMTAGTMFLMWLGDQITERGIGNGVSLIISVGILAQLPAGLIQAWRTFVPSSTEAAAASPIILVLLCLFLVIVIGAVIAITQAQRKISIQYAKRVVGRKVYGGQTQYMPLKINYAGVMPIIFAQAILLFPTSLIQWAFPESRGAQEFAALLSAGWLHYVLYGVMIFFFSYFWVATQFQPVQIADDLKKYGGFIPGVRPGKPTADFLDFTMSRLTFAGAIFLTIVAVLPQLMAQSLNVPYMTAQFFGGTGVLIIVGVVLDTMRQVETHLLQRHYDGFLRKGKIRGARDQRARLGSGQVLNDNTLVLIWTGVGALVIAGVIFFALQR